MASRVDRLKAVLQRSPAEPGPLTRTPSGNPTEPFLIALLDVDYLEPGAVAAAVLAHTWVDPAPAAEVVAFRTEVAEYVPGEFYRRELPCLLAVVSRCPAMPDVIVVDGYVWLGPDRPGLGARLHEALGGNVPVVGVGKTSFL